MHKRIPYMNILVTGGAWFIGSHLAKALIAEWHMVVVADDLSWGFERNIPDEALFERVDLSEKKDVELLFKKYEFDAVYHLAAYAAEWLSFFIPEFNYKNNLLASVHIITECVKSKVKRIIFTSSMAVYGNQEVPYTEQMTPHPEDPYGVAKYAVELHLEAMHKVHGLEYVIFRPQNVYGRNQHIGDSYRNVIGIFINQAMKGIPLTIFWDGEQKRAFSHISTIIPYFVAALTNTDCVWHVFNIGWEKPYTINELAAGIVGEFGMATIVNEPPRHEVKFAYASPRKAKIFFKEVSYNTVELREGLHDMVEWAQEIWPQEPTKFDGVEIKENMPHKWETLLT